MIIVFFVQNWPSYLSVKRSLCKYINQTSGKMTELHRKDDDIINNASWLNRVWLHGCKAFKVLLTGHCLGKPNGGVALRRKVGVDVCVFDTQYWEEVLYWLEKVSVQGYCISIMWIYIYIYILSVLCDIYIYICIYHQNLQISQFPLF